MASSLASLLAWPVQRGRGGQRSVGLGARQPLLGSPASLASPAQCRGLLRLQPVEPQLEGIKQGNEILCFLTERSNRL